jgi:chromosome segregation ATPase
MANVDKFTRAATGHLCAHFERSKDENGEYIRFGNQNIDTEKTAQNYNLAPDHEGGQVEFIRKRTSEVKCLNRADVNVMCSWVVTLPQGFDNERDFFEETYKFLSERYGEKNVVSAYVHMDEKQPHIHFSFVPMVVGKNGKEKVSAKELLTKTELQRFHPELQRTLEHALGREVPVLNGATAGGNRTVAEMKAEEDVLRARETAENAAREAEKTLRDVEALQNQKNALQGDLEGLQAKILSVKEVNALKGRKTITGALKGVGYQDYESLRLTAKHVKKMESERDKANERAKAAEGKIAAAEQRVRQAQNEKPSMKMQMENATLKRRLERIEGWLRRLVEYLPEQLRVAVNNILRDQDPFKREQRQHQDRGFEP